MASATLGQILWSSVVGVKISQSVQHMSASPPCLCALPCLQPCPCHRLFVCPQKVICSPQSTTSTRNPGTSLAWWCRYRQVHAAQPDRGHFGALPGPHHPQPPNTFCHLQPAPCGRPGLGPESTAVHVPLLRQHAGAGAQVLPVTRRLHVEERQSLWSWPGGTKRASH